MSLRKPIFTALLILFTIQFALSKENNNNNICVSKTVNSINVSIDGREELISIIQYLGGYFRLNKLDLDYKIAVDDYFEIYKNHEAVKFVKKLTKQGFNYDAPVTAMLFFSDEFELNKEFSSYLIKRIGGESNVEKFAYLMKKFATDTKFHDFLQSQNTFYTQIVNEFSDNLSDFHEIATIEEFYGRKQHSYNIILSVLNSGNYGPSIKNGKETNIYSIMSAKKSIEGKPTFGNANDILYLVWHEFGHSFVNHLTDENYDLVDNYSDLQNPIKKQMRSQAYGNWATIVNEHIIRAITVKLTELKYGEEVANRMKQREIDRSFYYITPICNYLDIYIQNRDQYKEFSDFYPILVESAFTEAKKTNYIVEQLKNLNSTYQDIDFIVVSEDEKDENIQKEILSYVKGVKDKFFKNTKLITDKEAINMDISKYSFLIYGTVKNNVLLQEFKNELPIYISDSIIKAKEQYTLSDGKAIFNMKNPLNSKEYIIVYTAQRSKGIVGINNVFHGGSNYIIFKDGDNVLTSANFVKENNKWVCK